MEGSRDHKKKDSVRFVVNALSGQIDFTMVVGLGIITFRLHDCRSLKGKRSIVKAISSKIRNQFNISIAEVGSNDIYKRAEIGFALVGNNRKLINSKVDKVCNMADQIGLAELIDTDIEIINI